MKLNKLYLILRSFFFFKWARIFTFVLWITVKSSSWKMFVRCDLISRRLKFLVTLQSIETITEECRKRVDQTPAVSSYSKYHQYCLNLDETQLILPIPLHVAPTFQTELGQLVYFLILPLLIQWNNSKENLKVLNLTLEIEQNTSLTLRNSMNCLDLRHFMNLI